MMNGAITHTALAALLLACGAGAARAEGFYAGGSVGGSDWSGSVDGVRGSGSGASGKLFGGYEFSTNFALEAGAMSLGHMRDSAGEASASGVYLDGVGRYEFAPQWSILGRVGVANARFSTPGGDHSDTGVKAGVGVQYDLTPTVALRGEYEYYHFHDAFSFQGQGRPVHRRCEGRVLRMSRRTGSAGCPFRDCAS